MVLARIPDEFPQMARNLTSDAVRLFWDVLAYERRDPQPGDQHLTIHADDVDRATYLPRPLIPDAATELLAAGWWEDRGPRVYIGGPPVIADLQHTRDAIDERRAQIRARVDKHRQKKRTEQSDSSAELDANPHAITAHPNPTQPNPVQDALPNALRNALQPPVPDWTELA